MPLDTLASPWIIRFDYVAAIPFYIAGVNQLVLAVAVRIGARITDKEVRKRESQPIAAQTIYTEDGNKTSLEIPDGFIVGQFRTEDTSTDKLLGLQSRNRDAMLVVAGVLILMPAILTSDHLNGDQKLWITLVFGVIGIAVAVGIFIFRGFYDKARILVFDITTIILTLATIVIGTIVGMHSPKTCRPSDSPAAWVVFQSSRLPFSV